MYTYGGGKYNEVCLNIKLTLYRIKDKHQTDINSYPKIQQYINGYEFCRKAH